MKTLLFAGLLLSGLGAQAQQPGFASPEKAASHRAAFARKVKALQLVRDPDWYYRYQVDVTKAKVLRKEGIDLAMLDKRTGPGTYRENLLYTATVVKGTVIGRKSDDRKEVYFHSLCEVKVDEVLAGQLTATVVTVCLRSGPVGDGSVRVRTEPALAVGEQVLLYLNPVDFEELAAARAEGSWNYEPNAKPGDFTLVEKYLVKEDYVFEADNSRVDRITTVSTNIRRIAALLDKASFNQKSFD